MNKINDKFSIVLQGNFDSTVYNQSKYVDHYLEYVKKVIISCYDYNDTSYVENDNLTEKYVDRFVLVKSPPFTHPHNPCNMYAQAYSSYNGIKLVDTEFTIKIRTDEFYYQVDKIINKVEQNPEKYITCNLSSPKIKVRPLQPGDHLLGAKTSYLLEEFETVMAWCNKFSEGKGKGDHFDLRPCIDLPYDPGGNAETTMFFAFLKAKKVDLHPIHNRDRGAIYEFMKTHIDIMNINDLKPIIWSCHPGDPNSTVYYDHNPYDKDDAIASSLEDLGEGL